MSRNPAPHCCPRNGSGRDSRTESGACTSHGGVLNLKREIADQCLASAHRELDNKSGKEFAQYYIGMQIGAHMYVVDAMTVFQRHASPELRQTIAAGEETAQGHLQMAKNIMKQQSQRARGVSDLR